MGCGNSQAKKTKFQSKVSSPMKFVTPKKMNLVEQEKTPNKDTNSFKFAERKLIEFDEVEKEYCGVSDVSMSHKFLNLGQERSGPKKRLFRRPNSTTDDNFITKKISGNYQERNKFRFPSLDVEIPETQKDVKMQRNTSKSDNLHADSNKIRQHLNLQNINLDNSFAPSIQNFDDNLSSPMTPLTNKLLQLTPISSKTEIESSYVDNRFQADFGQANGPINKFLQGEDNLNEDLSECTSKSNNDTFPMDIEVPSIGISPDNLTKKTDVTNPNLKLSNEEFRKLRKMSSEIIKPKKNNFQIEDIKKSIRDNLKRQNSIGQINAKPCQTLIQSAKRKTNANTGFKIFRRYSEVYESGLNIQKGSQVSQNSSRQNYSHRYVHDLGNTKISDSLQGSTEYCSSSKIQSSGYESSKLRMQSQKFNSSKKFLQNSTTESSKAKFFLSGAKKLSQSSSKQFIINKHSLFCARRDLLEECDNDDKPSTFNKFGRSDSVKIVSYKRVSSTLSRQNSMGSLLNTSKPKKSVNLPIGCLYGFDSSKNSSGSKRVESPYNFRQYVEDSGKKICEKEIVGQIFFPHKMIKLSQQDCQLSAKADTMEFNKYQHDDGRPIVLRRTYSNQLTFAPKGRFRTHSLSKYLTNTNVKSKQSREIFGVDNSNDCGLDLKELEKEKVLKQFEIGKNHNDLSLIMKSNTDLQSRENIGQQNFRNQEVSCNFPRIVLEGTENSKDFAKFMTISPEARKKSYTSRISIKAFPIQKIITETTTRSSDKLCKKEIKENCSSSFLDLPENFEVISGPYYNKAQKRKNGKRSSRLEVFSNESLTSIDHNLLQDDFDDDLFIMNQVIQKSRQLDAL